MNRRPNRWHIGAVALALLVVAVATGAAVGHSAPVQSTASDTLVDGTTDTITNLDPAGTYDFGTFTLDANVFEHLLDFKNGVEDRAVPCDEVLLGRDAEDVAVQSSARRQVP